MNYSGKISLVSIKDSEGVGIKNSRVLYAVSSNGTIPPELEKQVLTSEDGILKFSQIGNTFRVQNNVLYAYQGNILTTLKNDSGIITGTAGWENEIPQVMPGSYLWIKTIIEYTNDESTISYSVSRQGEDGPKGDKGERGDRAVSYYMEANQPNILKFEEKGQIKLSPEILEINIYEEDCSLETGRKQLENLSLDNLVIRFFNIKRETWHVLEKEKFRDFIALNKNENTFQIDLVKIYEGQIYQNLLNFLEADENVFEFSYNLKIGEENFYPSILINDNFGMTKDVAIFSQNAADITAAIQNTKLKFDANGLTVTNGGLKIDNIDGVTVFESDDDGNLTLKGTIDAQNGKIGGFYIKDGQIYSEIVDDNRIPYIKLNGITGLAEIRQGKFTGKIEAQSGEIGCFNITKNLLQSSKVDINGTPILKMDGAQGEIIVGNVKIGNNCIKIGKNETVIIEGSSNFLRVQDMNENNILLMNDSGEIIVGDRTKGKAIYIDGQEGVIKTDNYSSNEGWSISSSEAVFNNVVVRGSIKSSVLEYGEVQTIGGIMMVRPSSRIKSMEETGEKIYNIVLENATGFNKNDCCVIAKDNVKYWCEILEIKNNNIKIKADKELSLELISFPIINFGQDKSVGIGINSTTDKSLVASNSLSIFEFNKETKELIPRIILGKLDDYNLNYGLYAENVLLKGSLVTHTPTSEDSIYSGISTIYPSYNDSPRSDKYAEFFNNKTGEILLWAGAKDNTPEAIQNSKFFVDKYGNLYAGSGYFEGTIISKATISASEIKTAIITGTGYNEDYALTIQDASKGIVFKGNNSGLVFSLSENEIRAKVSDKIVFNEHLEINKNGELIISQNDSSILLRNNKIIKTEKEYQSYIEFEKDIIISPNSKGVGTVRFSTQEMEINNNMRILGQINYGEEEHMKYEPVYSNEILLGYDLYID